MKVRVEGAITMFFNNKNGIPQERLKYVVYVCIVCDYREDKDEPNRTSLIVGGDRINDPNNCGTPTEDLLWQVSSSLIAPYPHRGKFFTVDIKTYISIPHNRYRYISLKLADIPEDIIEEY